MLQQLRAAIVSFILLSVLTGIAYPAAVTAVAHVFNHQRTGSIVERDGQAVGSELIGQFFDDPGYFWSRPSATTDADGEALPYNGVAGSGSNLALSNPAETEAVRRRVAMLRAADLHNESPVPIDLVTASASGLDPHISVRAAEYQAGRVAAARHLPRREVERLVHLATEDRTLGLLGEPRVNVLRLNLSLDALRR